MDLKKIKEVQREFDKTHGWSRKNDSVLELLDLLTKDLVGLFGEIGELANIVKKLNLESERQDTKTTTNKLEDARENLSEELIDSLIYLIRIATHLEIDIESSYLKKIAIIKERYRIYEINKHK